MKKYLVMELIKAGNTSEFFVEQFDDMAEAFEYWRGNPNERTVIEARVVQENELREVVNDEAGQAKDSEPTQREIVEGSITISGTLTDEQAKDLTGLIKAFNAKNG